MGTRPFKFGEVIDNISETVLNSDVVTRGH